MKEFETMSELDILHAANTTVLNRWVCEREKVERNPDDEIAKYHMLHYWEKLQELQNEIIRLEILESQN